MIRIIELGGIPIPMLATLGVTQTYVPAVRETILAMGDGTLDKQTLSGTEGKVTTTVSADGLIPPGLTGLTYEDSLVLKCGVPRDIVSVSNIITIPSLRRTDANYIPWGRAFVNDVPVNTPVALDVNEATLTVVAGASAYQVMWYPQFYVYAVGGINVTVDEFGAKVQWQLNMRQI